MKQKRKKASKLAPDGRLLASDRQTVPFQKVTADCEALTLGDRQKIAKLQTHSCICIHTRITRGKSATGGVSLEGGLL